MSPMNATRTPISLSVSDPAIDMMAGLTGVELGPMLSYYLDRIGDGNFERFMEKTESIHEGWEGIRVLRLRAALAGEDTIRQLAFITACRPPAEPGDSAEVLIVSVEMLSTVGEPD